MQFAVSKAGHLEAERVTCSVLQIDRQVARFVAKTSPETRRKPELAMTDDNANSAENKQLFCRYT